MLSHDLKGQLPGYAHHTASGGTERNNIRNTMRERIKNQTSPGREHNTNSREVDMISLM